MDTAIQNKYIHPLAQYKEVSTGFAPAHTDALINALDFDCPEGTEIRAAADGVVVLTKDDSNKGGVLDIRYYNDGNRIVLQHANGEFTAYEHLRFKGVSVKVGQQVTQGEAIGYSGNTGYSGCPHLHFEVFVNPHNKEFEGDTLKVKFQDY